MNDEPQGTNTDNVAYDAATEIATITTTGNVIVTLSYHNVSGVLIRGFTPFIDFLPIVFMLVSLEARRREFIDNRMLGYALVMFAVSAVIMAIRAMGY